MVGVQKIQFHISARVPNSEESRVNCQCNYQSIVRDRAEPDGFIERDKYRDACRIKRVVQLRARPGGLLRGHAHCTRGYPALSQLIDRLIATAIPSACCLAL